mgnify:CR=1 FL=1
MTLTDKQTGLAVSGETALVAPEDLLPADGGSPSVFYPNTDIREWFETWTKGYAPTAEFTQNENGEYIVRGMHDNYLAFVAGWVMSDFMREREQEWQPTERDNRLHELATRYRTECEAYDQTVCTGPMGRDGIIPANPQEMALINRNAHAVRKRLMEEAAREGIESEELARAINKWHGSLPNVGIERPGTGPLE